MTTFKILSHNRRMQVFKFQENRNLSFMISESSSIRTEKKKIFINNMFSNLIKRRNSIKNDLRNLNMNDYHEL